MTAERGDPYGEVYGAYVFTNWKSAGFAKPTFSGTKTSGIITFNEIYQVIGHLSETDTRHLVDKYNSVEQTKVLEGLNENNTISFERFWKEFGD